MKGRLLLSAGLAALLCACAQKPPASAAASLAASSAQRGAQAFARGDMAAAQREYATALRVHESLDDAPGRAAALLSLARIAAQTGRPAEAQEAIDQVLADAARLDPALLATAHGRSAALRLAQGDAEGAEAPLARAAALCAGTCADAGALAVLRARLTLARGQPAAALAQLQAALALPGLAAATPPTLRPQAGAERANALRLQGQAHLALGQAEAAAGAAQAALDLDRALGLSERVLADLRLLAEAAAARGDAAGAVRYRQLAARAEAAGRALRGLQPDDGSAPPASMPAAATPAAPGR
jgi:tetratricopeptide (TPR) repeat protein